MKNKHLLLPLLVVVMICGLISSCSKKGVSKLNVVTDIRPVSTALTEGFDITAFRQADSLAQERMLHLHRDRLIKNIMNTYPEVEYPNWIKFTIATGAAEGVQSGDGKLYNGLFQKEIVIEITKGAKKGKYFLACANGMLNAVYNSYRELTQCRYTVKEGESLYTILEALHSNDLWMDAAKRMDIGIRNAKGEKVDYETYSKILGKYESMLRPGDIIDFCEEIVLSGMETVVDFDQRQKDTEKANLKTLKITIKEGSSRQRKR